MENAPLFLLTIPPWERNHLSAQSDVSRTEWPAFAPCKLAVFFPKTKRYFTGPLIYLLCHCQGNHVSGSPSFARPQPVIVFVPVASDGSNKRACHLRQRLAKARKVCCLRCGAAAVSPLKPPSVGLHPVVKRSLRVLGADHTYTMLYMSHLGRRAFPFLIALPKTVRFFFGSLPGRRFPMAVTGNCFDWADVPQPCIPLRTQSITGRLAVIGRCS